MLLKFVNNTDFAVLLEGVHGIRGLPGLDGLPGTKGLLGSPGMFQLLIVTYNMKT